MAMRAAGTKYTSEPGTHMIKPAQLWSPRTVVPKSLGAAKYVG